MIFLWLQCIKKEIILIKYRILFERCKIFLKILPYFLYSLHGFEEPAILIQLFYFTIPDITDEYSISKKKDAGSKKGVDRKG